MSTAIKFENISKQYRLGLVSTNTISHDLNRWWQMNIRGKEDPYLKIGEINDRSSKGESDYVWALKDINFEVQQGDVLGIIGKNGAGKSTLLKILSKVTAPSTGSIKAKGRIASLLEVGTGFHPEMTGRENIYMNGSIMGMTKAEISRKLDEIVDFSGVERYLDTPVKRYSSGMTVRLGFAIAAYLEPEILVVDEVLAVGDAEFQKKAIGKMQDVSKGQGRTVLFVSHNMAAVKSLCNKGVVLENGMIGFSGNIEESINYYTNNESFESRPILDGIKYHNSLIHITSLTINGSDQNIINIDSQNNKLHFKVSGTVDAPSKVALEFRMYDYDNVLLGVFSPGHVKGEVPLFDTGNFEFENIVEFPHNLTKGDFYLSLSLSHPNVEFLATLNNPVKLVSGGIVGESGLSFEYKGCGLLML